MRTLSPPTANEVTDATSFIRWAQAYLGAPPATLQDVKILNKKAKDLFVAVPGADWSTLVQVAQWCRANKRRMARVWGYVDQYRWAWSAGAIEVKGADDVDSDILAAIALEHDRPWKARLRRAAGHEAKKEVLEEWRLKRGT